MCWGWVTIPTSTMCSHAPFHLALTSCPHREQLCCTAPSSYADVPTVWRMYPYPHYPQKCSKCEWEERDRDAAKRAAGAAEWERKQAWWRGERR